MNDVIVMFGRSVLDEPAIRQEMRSQAATKNKGLGRITMEPSGIPEMPIKFVGVLE